MISTQVAPNWHVNTNINDMPEYVKLMLNGDILITYKIVKWVQEDGAKIGFMPNGHCIYLLKTTIDKLPATEEEFKQHNF